MNTRRDNQFIQGFDNSIEGWWARNEKRLELAEEKEQREKTQRKERLWFGAFGGAVVAMILITVVISATVGW